MPSELSLLEKHEKYCAGASTFSKSIYRFPEQYPHFITKAECCYVWNEKGDQFIDFVSSLGAITLGYNHPEVNDAVKKQIDNGNLFSLCSDIEAECAEVLCKETQSDKCLFVKTGSDATTAAVRLAKAYTGREDVLYCKGHYHGWGGWFSISQDIHKGVNDCLRWHINSFEYNNLESLKEVLDNDVACIIIEPITYTTPAPNYLIELQKMAHDNGSLFITDEIVSYPRFGDWIQESLGQKYKSDLKCIGKGIANGYALSAVVGNEDVLNQRKNEEVFISGTMFGESVPMIAAMKTLEIFKRDDVANHIWDDGYTLSSEFNKLATENKVPIEMIGLPPRMVLKYKNNDIKSLFLQETAKLGLIVGNIIYPTASHTEEILNETIFILDDALRTVSYCIDNDVVEESIIGRKCRDLILRKT